MGCDECGLAEFPADRRPGARQPASRETLEAKDGQHLSCPAGGEESAQGHETGKHEHLFAPPQP